MRAHHCLAAVLLALPAAAAPVRTISLADALKLAAENNPDFKSTNYDVRSAQGAVIQASVLPNPSLLVGSLVNPVKPIGGPVPNQFGLNFTIPIGGKISAATASAEAALEAAKATREGARRTLVFNVQTSFVALQLAQLLLDFAKQDQDGFHKELDLNELRYKDGKIAFGDLLKLRIQAVTTDDEVREAIVQLENARADLRRVVGEDVLTEEFQISGELTAPQAPKLDAIEPLLTKALSKRPDYLALIEQEKSAQSALTAAKRAPIPDLSFLFDYNRPQEGQPPSYDLLLTIPLPIFDRNQGNVIQAEAALEKAKLAQVSLRTQLRADLWKGVQEWQAASSLLAVYQGGVADAAKESLEIRKHAYELGNGTLLDYLDAEASYRQIESAYRSAFARAVNAANNVQFATGEVQP